jgi:uncharacterized protein
MTGRVTAGRVAAGRVPAGRVVEVPTSQGPARMHVHLADEDARQARIRWLLVLGHGAGGGVQARDLAVLARKLPATGTTVVLVEQPWRVAGRRVASPPPRLDAAWIDVLAGESFEQLTGTARSRLRVAVGGRSAGARVACRTATTVGADAVVALAFPLHPPGRPDRSRVGELLGAGVPTVVFQGTRDAFGQPDEFPPAARVEPIAGADHGMAVGKSAPLTQAQALDAIVDGVIAFLASVSRPAVLSAGRSVRGVR